MSQQSLFPSHHPLNSSLTFCFNMLTLRRKYNHRFSGGEAGFSTWTREFVEEMIANASKDHLQGGYGFEPSHDMRSGMHAMNLKGKIVLVIGSVMPWAEAIALEAGAREVHTLEYGRIHCTHPKIKTMTPWEARARVLNGTMIKYDAIISYSSVEHSGLGRYGDALNPWGDMQSIARAWCITKPGGQMLLGVMECPTEDRIDFNLHRCYHSALYTQLTANWEQLDRFGKTGQPPYLYRRA